MKHISKLKHVAFAVDHIPDGVPDGIWLHHTQVACNIMDKDMVPVYTYSRMPYLGQLHFCTVFR